MNGLAVRLPVSRALVVAAVVMVVLAALPSPGRAQIFVASRPNTDLTIGPLYVVARVTPDLGPVTMNVYFSLVVPPGRSAADMDQDIYLLWPGAVTATENGHAEPQLLQFIKDRHFSVVAEGRLALSARNLYRLDGELPPEKIRGGASFVTYVREGGALGRTSPATWIRIPWTPRLINRAWLVDLMFKAPGLIRSKRATWIEEIFRGRRQLVSVSFNDLGSRSLFPLYFEHRDRLIHLAEEPSQVIVSFTRPDELKIVQVSPPAASQRAGEGAQPTEMVSLFLERAAGLAPQVLTVEFGYFSGVQAWALILIPTAFFVLGNAAGPLVSLAVRRLGKRIAARIHLGPATRVDVGRSSGVVPPRETLARITPGETTYEDVIRLLGPDAEERERLDQPGHRTLIYRGRHVVPRRRRTFGWFTTVGDWNVENHEVEIEFDADRVRQVQARVRRARLPHPEED